LQRKRQDIEHVMSSDFWRQWQTLGPFSWNGDTTSAPPGFPPAGFAPFADSAERFAAAAREFAAHAQRATAASKDPSQAAFAAAEGFGNFLRDHFAGCFSTPCGAPPGAAPMGAAFTDAPALGLGREQALRAQRAAEACKNLMEAQGRLQRLWSDTLREAATAFSSRPQPAPGEAPTQEAIDRLYDQWIDCAEEAYARTAHSDAFCDALAAYVNAGSLWRRESAADIEEWAKPLDLPTRSEINALTLRMRELEARLAAMEKPTRPARAASPPKPPRSSKRARSAHARTAASKRSK
jgi:hypothetical protein